MRMSKGFDCATPLTRSTALKFVQDGYTFVCRYLAPEDSWKRLTANEAQIITDAGLWIISVFERGADRAKGGAKNGAEDGKLALQYAKEVGQPEGTVIYFAVDFDTTPNDYDAIENYLRAADEQIIGYECAVYGEKEVCDEMLKRGVVKRVWQTYAWSHEQKVDDPNVYQYQNDIVVNGIGIDLDESNGDAGGWKVGMVIETGYKLNKADADQIIAILSDYWHRMEGNKVVQDYTHYLANEVRKASGQTTE
jgi:hypothetical protein